MKMFHSFHMVTSSPWPLIVSLAVVNLMMTLVEVFLSLKNLMSLMLGFVILLISLYLWWRDVIREGLMLGDHSDQVKWGFKLGVVLFITSEVFFFLSFFWSYFYYSLSPDFEVGLVWPPSGIMGFEVYGVPLLNTMILLSSGVSVTWAHYELMKSNYFEAMLSLGATLGLGCYFLCVQSVEYMVASFSISDSVYGSIFFMATGFHGLHVLIGVIFLSVSLWRLKKMQFSVNVHFNFEAAAWYWHFVDVVWLFLYLFVYWFFG